MGFGLNPHGGMFQDFDATETNGFVAATGFPGTSFSSVQTFSGGLGGVGLGAHPAAGGMNMRSSSTSTKFVNGKKITTKR